MTSSTSPTRSTRTAGSLQGRPGCCTHGPWSGTRTPSRHRQVRQQQCARRSGSQLHRLASRWSKHPTRWSRSRPGSWQHCKSGSRGGWGRRSPRGGRGWQCCGSGSGSRCHRSWCTCSRHSSWTRRSGRGKGHPDNSAARRDGGSRRHRGRAPPRRCGRGSGCRCCRSWSRRSTEQR
jgi:hypothetical protein